MIIADPRPMSSAPFDGTPVRLFVFAGCAIASFWSEDRSQKAFGPGDYRAGWYLLDDDAVELDEPMGWEPLALEIELRLCGRSTNYGREHSALVIWNASSPYCRRALGASKGERLWRMQV
jgi:hypothetical protein